MPVLQGVVSSLATLDERFDGKGAQGLPGPSIPLLSRILAALQAMVLDEGRPFVSDRDRFDPEIVESLAGVDKAA